MSLNKKENLILASDRVKESLEEEKCYQRDHTKLQLKRRRKYQQIMMRMKRIFLSFEKAKPLLIYALGLKIHEEGEDCYHKYKQEHTRDLTRKKYAVTQCFGEPRQSFVLNNIYLT